MENIIEFEDFVFEMEASLIEHDCNGIHPGLSHVKWYVEQENPAGYPPPHGTDLEAKPEKEGNLEDQGNAGKTHTDTVEPAEDHSKKTEGEKDERDLEGSLEDETPSTKTHTETKV